MIQISVVIPCRNEVRYIEECVSAIFNSQVEKNVQLNVFVVDGLSDDGTRELVAELNNKFPTLHLLDNKRQLTPFAFNIGIHATAFDYVQIVGARQILPPNYIQTCLNRLQADPDSWCVGGSVQNEYLNQTGKIIATAMGTTLGMGLGNFRTLKSSGYTDTVGTPMYPKFVFDKIGYFDEDLIRNQDDDFNYRVTQAGGKIFFENDASLKYYVRGDFKGLWRQFFQYGYWKVFVNQKHKAVTTLRQLVPPAFVTYLIVLPLLSLWTGIFLLPLLIYLLLVWLVSFHQSIKAQLPFPSLLLTFFILHISYGLGYLKGIVEFLIRKKKPSDKQKRLSR